MALATVLMVYLVGLAMGAVIDGGSLTDFAFGGIEAPSNPIDYLLFLPMVAFALIKIIVAAVTFVYIEQELVRWLLTGVGGTFLIAGLVSVFK